MANSLETAKKQRGKPFKKGQSGNPNGRPKKTPELIEVENLCRDLSPSAVERLADWMKSDNARASVAAATGIIERAFGKPRQPVEHTGKDGGPIETKSTHTIDASEMEPEEREALRAILAGVKKAE